MLSIRAKDDRLRALVYGGLGAVVAILAIGIPTDVVPNPWFERPSTPVRPQDYGILAASAVLAALLAASYALPQTRLCPTERGKTMFGGLLSLMAVGCPTCNKIVVLLMGTSGALSWFEPIQPVVGLLSVALLGLAVWVRWRPVFQPRPGA